MQKSTKPFLYKLTFSLLIFIFLIFAFSHKAQAIELKDCDGRSDKKSCLEEVQKYYEDQINSLQAQAGTLSNQIAQFNAQIYLTEAKIESTQEQIDLLGGRIDQLTVSLSSLTKAFQSRAQETYKISRLSKSVAFLISSPDIKNVVSRYYYLQKIQEEDHNLLSRLSSAQTTYKDQKGDLEDLNQVLGAQKEDLNSQKAAKNNLLSVTKNSEKQYQQLLAQAKAQLAAFSRFASSQGGATILNNQTKCDIPNWAGCYYNQRDSLWANMTLGGTSYQMKDSGCFVTSVAMLASHYGKNIKPNDIASVPAVFTNQGDLKWEPFNVNGANITISSDSKSNLDQRLSSGPVIAKLSFSYGDHFIVILRKEGDTYYMNDPFMENGYNKPLTDKYSVSDITSLRLVTFN